MTDTTKSSAPTLWDKIKAWFAGEIAWAAVELNDVEKDLVSIAEPILAAGEASAITDLKAEVTTVLSSIETPKTWTLPDLETAVLNGLKTAESALLPLAEGMGSTVFQAFIGLILAKL